MATIEPKQIKLIHCLKGALGLDDPTYRGLLSGRYGKDTSKRLTYQEASELIREMETAAVSAGVWRRKEKKYDRMGSRPGFATPKQLRMIEGMWKDVSRATTEEDRKTALRHFLVRIVGIEDLRFLEPGHVRKVVNALNAMKAAKAA